MCKKKNIPVFLFLLMFWFIPSGKVISQNSGIIKGSVKDTATGESIPYAIIQISGTKFGTSANINGYYYLSNVPFGEWTVVVTAVGYKRYSSNLTINSEEIRSKNILLVPEPVMLKGVTKTIDRMKETYKTNISVQSISQKDLDLMPLAAEKDLFRAMKTLPGISSTGDVTSQFYVRGGSGDQNLVLLDNMVIYNPFHAFGLFSVVNGNAVKISEVFTGGFSPEYGGRLSSVINIITKEGNKNKFGGQLTAGSLSTQGMIEGPLFNGSFFLTFRKSYFSSILKKFIDKDLPLAFYDLSGKISIPTTDVGQVIITSLVSHDEVKNSNISEPDYLWDNNSFGLSLQTFLDKYLVNVSLSTSMFKSSVDKKNYKGKQNLESSINDFFFNSKVEMPVFSKDMLSFGFSFIFPAMSYKIVNNMGNYVDKNGTAREENAWIKYEFSQIDNLICDFGVRLNFDFLDKPEYAFEPRIGLKYELFPFLSLKASLSRYQQNMFTTFNEDDVIPLFEAWLPIKYPFFPESNQEYIIGTDLNLSENYNLTLQGYYRKFNNILNYNLKKSSASDPDFSAGTGKSYGVEGFFKFQTDLFWGWFNYTWSWSDRKVGRSIYHPRFDRRHNINALIGAKLPFDIDFNLLWEVSSGLPFTPIRSFFDKMQYPDLSDIGYDYEEGDPYAALGLKNSSRLPWYHKLDVNFSKSLILYEEIKMKMELSLINLYNYKNIFYFDKNTCESVYMLPFMPTFSIGVEL